MTTSKPLLVVLGATGNQGLPVLTYFSSLPQSQPFSLRGITRNTSSPTAQHLISLGVEMIQADLSSVSSLKTAFSGATHIFANTDSNQHIYNAISDPSILSPGETPTTYAAEIEREQGITLMEAAAATETLERIVWSSLTSPKKWSGGKYTNVTMFDVKSDICEMMKEKAELKGKLSVLLVGFYATNMIKVPDLYGPKKQADGTFTLSLPMSGDVSFPMADLEADMGPWVNALFQASPGTNLVGATENITWREWLAKWAKSNKVDAHFVRAKREEYGVQLTGLKDALMEEFDFVEEFGLNGGDLAAKQPDELRKQGIEIRSSTIDAHIARCDWSSIV